MWGFVVGSGAIMASLATSGLSVSPTPAIVGMLAGAGVIAVAGGAIASRAYREVVGRRGG